MRGYRPVCEIQFDGFVYPAFDQIVSQVAKFHYRSAGRQKMPIVIRIPFGGGIGAVEHHSESPETYFAHTPGLKVVTCSNPVDAYWMIQQAIASDDPVIFFEPKRRYHEKAELDDRRSRRSPCTARESSGPGTDVTVLCYGPMVKTCLDAAGAAAEEGRSTRGDRPAHPVADRHGHRRRRRSARPGTPWSVHEALINLGLGRRARRPDHRAVLLLAGGAGAAGRRVRHPLPAEPGRGRVPAGPGPGARRGRPVAGLLSCSTRRGEQRVAIKEFRLPDPGEGLVEADIVTWRVAVGDEIKINDILVEIETSKSLVELPSPYAGHGDRAAGLRGRHRRRRRTDHRHRRRQRAAAAPAAAAAAAPRRTGPTDERRAGRRTWSATAPSRADTRRRPRKDAAGEAAPVEAHEQVNSTFATDAPVSRRADHREAAAAGAGASRRAVRCRRPDRPRRRRCRRRPVRCWPSRPSASSPAISVSTWRR